MFSKHAGNDLAIVVVIVSQFRKSRNLTVSGRDLFAKYRFGFFHLLYWEESTIVWCNLSLAIWD